MAHGASAPSPIDSAGSGTTSSGSISICEPSPVQRSHAPCGELKEKIRGSSSTSDGPCSGQAKRSEKVNTVPGSGATPGTICAAGARVRPSRPLALGPPLPLGRADDLDLDQAVGQADRRLDRVRQPLAHVVAHHQPVDDHRDVVLVALVEHDRLLQHAHSLVDLHAREAVRAQLVQQLAVLALAPAHDRREHHEARPLRELHHLVDDLLGRLPDDRAPADRAVRLAHARPQQPQVVVDLGHRADRRARVARGRLLVDRDRRREPLDRVHVRLVHLAQELARVGRQRLHVATLALRVDRVERQARLARARQARDHHERVARQRQRDVLEVVLARPRDDDLVAGRHVRLIL